MDIDRETKEPRGREPIPCPQCEAHAPVSSDSRLPPRKCVHFYRDLFPNGYTVMREMAAPHAWPMCFGDASYRQRDGKGMEHTRFLAVGMDADHVYFSVIPDGFGGEELPSRPVRMSREAAAYLGDELSCENTPLDVRREYEQWILRTLEQLQADPDADLEEYARRIYHHITDVD